MLTLWLITIILLATVLVVIVPILLGKGRYGLSNRKQQNIALAQARIRELETDHANNMLDESAYKEARQDIERALLNDVVGTEPTASNSVAQTNSAAVYTSVAVAFLLPVITVTLYLLLGNPSALQQTTNTMPSPTATVTNEPDPHVGDEMQGMIQKLASRLQAEPNNPEGWDLLARSYMSVNQYPEAVNALQKLQSLVGNHAEVLVRLADAMAMANGGSFSGRPAKLITQALALEPNNTTALWLAGMEAQARQDWSAAIKYWQQAQQGLSQDPKAVSELDKLISHARAASGVKPLAEENPAPATNMNANKTSGITVHVSLDPALQGKVNKNDTVFILAQMLDGPPMPLAVVKKRVADLPLTITLDDTLAMMPSHKLSMYKQIRVTARISKSGNARAQPGDLQVVKSPVTNSQEVNLVIK